MSYPFQQVRRMESSGMEIHEITRRAKLYKRSISVKTLRSIFEGPSAHRQLDTVKAIREAHDSVFDDTVHHYRINISPGLQETVDRYNRAFRGVRTADFEHEIEAIKNNVTEEIESYPQEFDYSKEVTWRRASLHWLLGRILSDELRELRENPRQREETDRIKKIALQQYEEASRLYLLLYGNDSGLANITYGLEANRIIVIFNSIPKTERLEDPEIVDLFESDNRRHRKLCLELINSEYFQWQAARNLMTDCQYLEDLMGYVEAFNLLVKACPKFEDLSYNPRLVDPIEKDNDTNLYIDVLRKKGIAK